MQGLNFSYDSTPNQTTSNNINQYSEWAVELATLNPSRTKENMHEIYLETLTHLRLLFYLIIMVFRAYQAC